MGFRDALDALLGTGRLPDANTERLFAISTATVTMQASLDLKPAGRAALCFKPIESSRYDAARAEIEDLLQLSCRETGSTCRLETDEYRFTWVVLEDPDFEDLVAGIHLVSQTLIERGFGPYLLCAVYRFDGTKRVYWIFNRPTLFPSSAPRSTDAIIWSKWRGARYTFPAAEMREIALSPRNPGAEGDLMRGEAVCIIFSG